MKVDKEKVLGLMYKTMSLSNEECPYCKDEEPSAIMDGFDYYCSVKIIGNILEVGTHDCYGDRCTEEKTINFCPMCGRKLSEVRND